MTLDVAGSGICPANNECILIDKYSCFQIDIVKLDQELVKAGSKD